MFFGQEKIQKSLTPLPKNGFIIVNGPEGSGKKTLIRKLCREQKREYIPTGNKIDSIREIVKDSKNNLDGRVYVLIHGDKMTNQAQNALLKIAEEPPKNSLVVMLLESIDNTLPTIISRGKLYLMEPYDKKDIQKYIEDNVAGKYLENGDTEFSELVYNIGEVEKYLKRERDIAGYLKKLEELVTFTMENALYVSSSNFLNISKYLALTKKNEEGNIYFEDFLACLKNKINSQIVEGYGSNSYEKIKGFHNILVMCSQAERELHKNKPVDKVVYRWAVGVTSF